MADAEVKPMSTIIFFSTSPDDHIRSVNTLVQAIMADKRCDHKMCFRPISVNFYQFIRGELDKEGHMQPIGCHEILYLPSVRTEEIARLERTKNVVLKINSMCFVGDNDKKKNKVKKIIDWLLEEREDIKL